MRWPIAFQLLSLQHSTSIFRGLTTLLWLSIFGLTSFGQGTFVSGSTGADGAFNPTTNQTLQLPESGVFNFTTVNIPNGVIIRFSRNSRNTPVTILATGDVTITGSIDVAGLPGTNVVGGKGGPGGFDGGSGGPPTVVVNGQNPNSPGHNGDGPGGGSGGGSATTPDTRGTGGGGGYGFPGLSGSNAPFVTGVTHAPGGTTYGLPTLLPLIGGSGGGGETGGSLHGAGGGGGGGALLIASSGVITFSGFSFIDASGAFGCICNPLNGSGGGSGGAVRLIANRITGTLRANVGGGAGGVVFGGSIRGGDGGGGYLRIEAFDLNSLDVQPLGTPNPRVITSTPGLVTSSNLPTIRIVSVAGIAAPNQPNGSLHAVPDILMPTSQPNPVNVALAATNIQPGTILQVTLTPENGARVVTQSTALAGTLASTTATASVTIPDGISVIQASGTIDVSSLGLVVKGERIKSIEINAVYGGDQTITYITSSNKRIKADQ